MILEIYKRGQGTAARIATGAGLGLFAVFGLYDIHSNMLDTWDSKLYGGIEWRTAFVGLLAVLCAGAVGWVVNAKRPADFLIVTEGELRKVSWPTRRELQRQALVVVVFTVLLGAIIFSADFCFVVTSRWLFIG